MLISLTIYTLTLWLGFYLINRDPREPRLLLGGLALTACALSLALAVLGGSPMIWVLVMIAVVLFGVGVWLALRDAKERGEAFLSDFLRAMDYSGVVVLLLGGQVALVMLLTGRSDPPLLALLLMMIASALGLQAFGGRAQDALDTLILARFPLLRKERHELRAASSAAARVDPAFDFKAVDDEEFVRLTRRALSALGDLPRLATSPLTYLPIIDARLARRDIEGNTLARAHELKTVLTESILRLKPSNNGGFGTSDEWRHYNALYYPYVVGLKPYSRRLDHDDLDTTARAALDWFQAQVPERTLYNWQTAAARLIAQELREAALNGQKNNYLH